MTKRFILLNILSVFFLSLSSQKGYEIKIKINNLKDTSVILGHYLAKNMYPDDTVRLNKNGYGVFKKKDNLPQGLYFIFLPNKTYFDIIIGENQTFQIEADTLDLFKKIKFTNSKENEIFYNYQYFLGNKKEEIRKLTEEKKNATSEDEKRTLSDKMKSIDESVKSFSKQIIDQNKNSFKRKNFHKINKLNVFINYQR